MTATVDPRVRRYRVEMSDKELDDLRSRIAPTRWPERETVTDDSHGVRLAHSGPRAVRATSYDMGRCDPHQFAAWEQPELFSAELRAAFGTPRSR